MGDNLMIYYQNCRGLRTKLHILFMNILSNCYDIIILTETWLTPEILDSEFIDQRYSIYRCDRDREATLKKDGGGTLIAVLRELQASKIENANVLSKHIEHLILRIPSATRGKCDIVCSVYIPPKTPESVYVAYLDLLQDVFGSENVQKFYIFGDYNLPETSWPATTGGYFSIQPHTNSHICRHLSIFMSVLNAYQYNNIKNSTGKLLDLVISNSDCSVITPTDILLTPDPYHPPL